MNASCALRLHWRNQRRHFFYALLICALAEPAWAESRSYDIPVSVTVPPQVGLSTAPDTHASATFDAAPAASSEAALNSAPVAITITAQANWGPPNRVTTRQTGATATGIVYTVTSL